MKSLWILSLLTLVSSIPLSQVCKILDMWRDIKNIMSCIPQKSHSYIPKFQYFSWFYTYIFSYKLLRGSTFAMGHTSSRRTPHHGSICGHSLLLRFNTIQPKISWTLDIFRNDAYGECELYGAHIVQVRLHKRIQLRLACWQVWEIAYLISSLSFDHLKFQHFQIDGLAESFCLLDYAHTAVRNFF